VLDLLYIVLIFIVVTTIGYLLSMNREYRISKFKIKFTLGGVLLFIGGERVPKRVKPLRRELHIAFIAVALLGIALFYLFFLPIIINMIKSFIEFVSGYSASPPQPTLVPLPLLFQYRELIAYLIVAIVVGVVVHEISHALVALREGIKIRSWGIGMLFLFPIAFVELDEEQFTKAPPRARINIATAGIFSNAIVSLISFIALFILSSMLPFLGNVSTAVTVTRIDCSICNVSLCPAQLIDVSVGDIIVAIDGSRVYSTNDVEKILRGKSIGSPLSITICSSGGCANKTAILSARNLRVYAEKGMEVPCLGISMAQTLVFEKNGLFLRYPTIENLFTYLNSIFIVNFSLYVLNAIPFIISDGSIFVGALSSIFQPLKTLSSRKLLDLINIAILVVAIVISSYIFLRFTQ